MERGIKAGIICWLLAVGSTTTGYAQTIRTIAGNGATGFLSGAYGGDGGPATAALLYYPGGLAYDAIGNLYVADSRNHRIRKIDGTGAISTFAGTGVSGYSGDSGPASAAEMGYPESMCIDGSGNLYVADKWEAVVRKIDAAGMITTVAGTGTYGFGGDGGPATAAMLDNPSYVAVDGAGNLYICDWINSRVRKVNTAGIITTIAGNGSAVHSGDGGPATAAGMRPISILVEPSGTLLIGDGANHRVRWVDAAGMITTIAGNGSDGTSGDGGPATAAGLKLPSSFLYDGAGNLLVCDEIGAMIRKIDGAGVISTIAGTGTAGYSGDGGSATAAEFQFPLMMAMSPAGRVVISDVQNNRVRELNMMGTTDVNQAESRNVRIYPNPVQDELSISDVAPNTFCSITDIAGRTEWRGFCGEGRITVPVRALPAGSYILYFTGADNVTRSTHIVKK